MQGDFSREGSTTHGEPGKSADKKAPGWHRALYFKYQNIKILLS